jgi:hypothetical protein
MRKRNNSFAGRRMRATASLSFMISRVSSERADSTGWGPWVRTGPKNPRNPP